MALMADHSHQSTPMLAGQEAGSSQNDAFDQPTGEYSEKDLDDALSYLDNVRRRSSVAVPGWAKRLADSTRVVGRKTGAVSRRSLFGVTLALILFLIIVPNFIEGGDTESFEAVKEPLLKEERPAGMLDAVVKAPSRVAGAVKELGMSAWDKAVGVTAEKPQVWKGLNISHVSSCLLARDGRREA